MGHLNYEVRKDGTREYLVLSGPWTPDVVRVMREEQLKDLRLSHYTEWKDKSIEFLREVPFLERLDLWAVGIRDISPLYELVNLKCLSLNMVTASIQFQRFPALQDLRIAGYRREVPFKSLPALQRVDLGNWNASVYSEIFHAKHLRRLSISGYTGADLSQFHELKHLEELGLGASSIKSLTGASQMPRLRRLALTLVNRLQDLSGLEDCGSLTHLSIEKAKILRNIDAISKLNDMQELGISDCPRLESIRPIRGLSKIRTVYMSHTTRVADGDLSVLKALPQLQHASFVDRPTYNCENNDFPKAYRLGGNIVSTLA
jgi:Leucine-rich repeat (LRR) protein